MSQQLHPDFGISARRLSSSLHKISGLFMRAAGFRLERYGEGALKIGMWRKALRSDRQSGERKGTFVLIPGFADSPLSWLPVLTFIHPRLARQFDEMVLFEFPGFHGYLYSERSFHSMDALLEVLNAALDSVDPHTIMGHSLGGGLAAHYAGIRGHGYTGRTRLQHLFLIAPSGVFVDKDFRSRIETRVRELVDNGIECLRDVCPYFMDGSNGIVNRFVCEFMNFAWRDEIHQFLESIEDKHLLDPLLPKIKARVDLVWGEKDALIPPAVVPCWLAGLTRARVEVTYLEGVGHAPQIEAPGRLSTLFGRLLKEVALQDRPATAVDAVDPFSEEFFPVLR